MKGMKRGRSRTTKVHKQISKLRPLGKITTSNSSSAIRRSGTPHEPPIPIINLFCFNDLPRNPNARYLLLKDGLLTEGTYLLR